MYPMVTTEEMLNFAKDFALEVRKIGGDNLLVHTKLRMAPAIDINLFMIEEDMDTEYLKDLTYEGEYQLREMVDEDYIDADDELVGYLMCEDFYEMVYSYEAYDEHYVDDELNKKAKKLYYLLYHVTEKYGLWFEWCEGAIALYKNKKDRG